MSEPCPQIAVIGLDGADWRLLQPWIDAGHLPTLARLIHDGASGDLVSTIRPESSVAWSSFATGVNPGKHGIYGFMHHADQPGQFNIANGSHIQANRFWDLLGKSGLNSALINIPFTYPPRPLHGLMITGMLTPNDTVEFAHPPELKSQLLEKFNTLMFDAGDDVTDKQTLLNNSQTFTQQQIDTTLHLIENNQPDFVSVVFTALDRLQHFLWSDLDPTHPDHSDQSAYFAEELLAHVKLLDSGIAKILAKLKPDAMVILISDHGFNTFARRFYINRWLIQKGVLVIQQSQNQRNQLLVSLLEKMKGVAWIRRLKQAVLPTDWGPQKLATALNTQSIDWEKTSVYYAPDGGLRPNPKNKNSSAAEIESLMTSLTQELTELVDPETDNRPIAHVYRSADLYKGDHASNAPDLIVEPQRSADSSLANYIIDSKLDSQDVIFSPSKPYSGNHDQNGILIASGPNIAAQKEMLAHIIDIAPTILAAFNVPLPNYFDGKPLTMIFKEDSQPAISYTDIQLLDEAIIGGGDLSHQEIDEDLDDLIEDRLRNLGYLD